MDPNQKKNSPFFSFKTTHALTVFFFLKTHLKNTHFHLKERFFCFLFFPSKPRHFLFLLSQNHFLPFSFFPQNKTKNTRTSIGFGFCLRRIVRRGSCWCEERGKAVAATTSDGGGVRRQIGYGDERNWWWWRPHLFCSFTYSVRMYQLRTKALIPVVRIRQISYKQKSHT